LTHSVGANTHVEIGCGKTLQVRLFGLIEEHRNTQKYGANARDRNQKQKHFNYSQKNATFTFKIFNNT